MLIAHTLLLVVMAGDYWVTRDLRKQKKMIVRTVQYSPPKIIPKTTIATSPPVKKSAPETAPKVKAAQPPKKENVKLTKQTTKTTPTEGKKKAVHTAPLPETIESIKESLESIATPTPSFQPKSEIAIPTLNPVVYFSNEPTDQDPTDTERITLLLQDLLQLPDYGEVKAFLEVDRWGKLQKLEIIDSKSAKNTEFLKKQLPEVQFPCLNETATLTIVFRNA